MSWSQYVKQSLCGSNIIDKASIHSNQGGAPWASEPEDWKPTDDELAILVKAFADTKDIKDVQSEGFHIAGERYVCIKCDDRDIWGKKGKTGIVIAKTKQAIIIGHYPEGVQPGPATKVVGDLSDYLISVGY
ncbi:profilin-A [Saccharata proteae CBS 121410]|uniref:Profilin n=1 Tax=Saccharata proteae CBS 121410 TaxID=1314787 RepID=A0A9P4HRN9_9PEZI|nr:profilin-A [Saccharata proteae CBS 121410]